MALVSERNGSGTGGSFGLVGPHAFVNFHVLEPRVESEVGEGPQGRVEGFLSGAGQDEVDVRDPNVVRPDVNLFHARRGHIKPYELDPRSGMRVTEFPSLYRFTFAR